MDNGWMRHANTRAAFLFVIAVALTVEAAAQGDDMRTYLAGMPKAELHLHLEGSLPAETVVALARRNGADEFLTVEEVEQSLRSREPGLGGFLDHYFRALEVLQTQEDFYQATYDLLERCRENNIVYVEFFFDPQAHTFRSIPFDAVLNGIHQGRLAGEKAFGVEANIIMAINREKSAESAFEMLDLAKPHRDKILGLGLDSGPEDGNPPTKFEAVYARAREEGYRLTAHNDVDQKNSVQHIWQSIDVLGVERIDHGINSIEDPELVAELNRRNVCLTASPVKRRADPEPQDLDRIRKMFDLGMCVSLHTDDPAQFETGYLTRMLTMVQEARAYTKAEMTRFVRNAFEAAWLPPDEKQAYLDRLDAYAAEHDVEISP